MILHVYCRGLKVSFLTSLCVCGPFIQAFPPPVPYNQSTHLAKTELHWALGDVQMEDFIKLGRLCLRQSAMLVLNLDGWEYSGVGLPLFLNVCFQGYKRL